MKWIDRHVSEARMEPLKGGTLGYPAVLSVPGAEQTDSLWAPRSQQESWNHKDLDTTRHQPSLVLYCLPVWPQFMSI